MRAAVPVIVALLLALAGNAAARESCLKYEEDVVNFTGPILPVDAQRNGRNVRYWVLRLPSSVCIEPGTGRKDPRERSIHDLQLAFPEGSPYYGIYKDMVDGRTVFQVSGRLIRARAARPVRPVALQVDNLVPKKGH